MKRSRSREPRYFAGYIHDMPGPLGSIISVSCEGPECDICLMDPAAKKRADAHRRGEKPQARPAAERIR